mgnify:FL=1
MHDKKEQKKVFQVNMLKACPVVACFTKEVLQEGVDETPVWKDDTAGEARFGEQLGTDQALQQKVVLDEFQEVFSNQPERDPLDETSH